MTPKLKPLILPQMVEERRKRESQATTISIASTSSSCVGSPAIWTPPPPTATSSITIVSNASTTSTASTVSTASIASTANTSEYEPSINYPTTTTILSLPLPLQQPPSHSRSHSDVPSPVTPTFSHGHTRYANSLSTFDVATQPQPFLPDHAPMATVVTQKLGKPYLPDVQEDPLEQDEEETMMDAVIDEKLGLYDCLCDHDYCLHREHSQGGNEEEEVQIVASPLSAHSEDFADYDFGGFGSDGEGSSSPRSASTRRKKRDGADSPLSSIARIGSRLPSLSRFKSSRRANLPVSPVSDLSLDSYPLSRDPSRSRSSSVSASTRHHHDRANEPPMPMPMPMPPTPALSFFDSNDSIGLPQPIDIAKANANAHLSIERERSLATTPLLPPLMTDPSPSPPKSSPKSHSQSPSLSLSLSLPKPHTQAPGLPQSASAVDLLPPAGLLPSPALSSKLSVSSFKPLTTPSEIPSMVQDAWSDRLGHANFIITPKPYSPTRRDMEALRQLRVDWDDARTAYGRHIARIGEHYGHTSKTYTLTEAKWRETQQEWQSTHDCLIDQIADSAKLEDQATLERIPMAVPKMHAMGSKFPSQGDEDIVGPMMRAVTMLPATGGEERKGNRFWRTFAEKVGLRR